MSAEEGFLARWSRRKQRAAAGGGADPAPPAPVPDDLPADAIPAPGAPAAVAADDGPAPHPAASDAAAVVGADAESGAVGLPPIESVTAETDVSAFLRPGVPAALRGAALRRVWALDPAIRDFVGPADYAWDYNAPDGVPGFALDLGEGAKRLLARAAGLGPEAEEGTTAPAEDRASEPVTGGAAVADAPEAMAGAIEAAVPAGASAPEAVAVAVAGPPPPPSRQAGASAPAAGPGPGEPIRPAARRHGGARPA